MEAHREERIPSEEVFTEMDGPFRIIRLTDVWRVIGRGFSITCKSEQRAMATLEKVRMIWEP